MAKLFNRVKVSTATVGSGTTVTLGAALAGFRTFAAAGVANGDTISYVIEDGTAWETGFAFYATATNTIVRYFMQSSTGSILSLSGNAQLYIAALAEDINPGYLKVTTSGNGNFTIPSGATFLLVRMWGGGGSGCCASSSVGGGGGGGGYKEKLYKMSDVGTAGSVVSYTVGAGGAAVGTVGKIVGNIGGNSSFSSIPVLTAYGGGPGDGNNPGTGPAYEAAGTSGAGSAGFGGTAGLGANATEPWGGGNGGASTVFNGGKALYGGGGGGYSDSTSVGGTSVFGGSGGAGSSTGNGTAGSQPAGGGGGCKNGFTSGKGGDGQIEFIWW